MPGLALISVPYNEEKPPAGHSRHSYELRQSRQLLPEEAVADKYAALEMLESPLAWLAYTLGDGAPYVRGDSERVLGWAVRGDRAHVLASAVERLVNGLGAKYSVLVHGRYVTVYGTCARTLAGWMLEEGGAVGLVDALDASSGEAPSGEDCYASLRTHVGLGTGRPCPCAGGRSAYTTCTAPLSRWRIWVGA